MFRGTLTRTSVYPREVVLRALHHHAGAVILAHNHPSGQVQASAADKAVTQNLQAALRLVDIQVLAHVIVPPGASLSTPRPGIPSPPRPPPRPPSPPPTPTLLT